VYKEGDLLRDYRPTGFSGADSTVKRSRGIIAHAFVDADYTKRMEPADIIKALKSL